MLRSPLGVAQAVLARPSHCGHTLWAHIEVITHNVEVVGTKFLKKVYIPIPRKISWERPPSSNTGVTNNPAKT